MEDYLGTIKIFGGNFVPKNFAICDGRLMDIGRNTALFSILGTKYGGDGINNFALPDLRPVNTSYKVRNSEVRRVRESGDPGNFAYLADDTVLEAKNKENWDEYPMYIICIEGLYPQRW